MAAIGIAAAALDESRAPALLSAVRSTASWSSPSAAPKMPRRKGRRARDALMARHDAVRAALYVPGGDETGSAKVAAAGSDGESSCDGGDQADASEGGGGGGGCSSGARSSGGGSGGSSSNGLECVYALLRSPNPDAVRCAAFTLSALAMHAPSDEQLFFGKSSLLARPWRRRACRAAAPEVIRNAPALVTRVFAPSVLVMLCRSRDVFLQAVGAQLVGALAAADANLRLRLLHAHAARPLAAIIRSSASAVARFEAMHALSRLTRMADADAVAALSLERSTRALLSALTSFAGSLLRPHKLRDLNAAINGKSYDAVLGYYAARPELARFTLERELDRMDYVVRTADGDELATPAAIRSFHGGLPANEQEGLLWRLANQSLLADVIGEMTLAGYVDMDLTAAVRATAVKYVLDLGAQLLRVTATVGVFVPPPTTAARGRRADGGARRRARRAARRRARRARRRGGRARRRRRRRRRLVAARAARRVLRGEARGAFADRRG